MISIYNTTLKKYELISDKFCCNKLGLAEFFANNIIQLSFPRKANVLDVGCGISPIGIFLADQYDCTVTGVELNSIAYNCSNYNIKKYKLESKIKVYNSNFVDFSCCNGDKYNVIVANPPVSEIVPADKIYKYKNYDYTVLDSESFSYLTNSWRSNDGGDLTDYIFEFGKSNLEDNGYIYIVFCNVDCKSPSYIIEKGKNNGFYVDNIFKGFIIPESIGFYSNKIDEIKAYIIKFRR